MHLILSTPSLDYAKQVSHELWMLARPRQFSAAETSQYYCGTFKHPNEDKVAIGPIDGFQNVHKDADETSFVDLIGDALTEGERLAIINAINVAKGGKIAMSEIIGASPSLSPNLVTRDQMQDLGWFDEPVVEDIIDV